MRESLLNIPSDGKTWESERAINLHDSRTESEKKMIVEDLTCISEDFFKDGLESGVWEESQKPNITEKMENGLKAAFSKYEQAQGGRVAVTL